MSLYSHRSQNDDVTGNRTDIPDKKERSDMEPKKQKNTFLIVSLLIIIAIGSYYVVTAARAGNVLGEQPSPQPVSMNAPSGGPGGMGGPGATCPTTQLSTLLGATITKGHSQSASGPGAGVESVSPGSLAAKAGLKSGDVIVSVDGKSVNCPNTTLSAIKAAVANAKPKSKIALTVDREGKSKKLLVASSLFQPKAAKNAAKAKVCTDKASCPVTGKAGSDKASCPMHAKQAGAKSGAGTCPDAGSDTCPLKKATTPEAK